MSENVLMDDPNLPILILIAQSLGELCESLVFVGGCATGLLLTTPRAQAIRATQDVNVVVHALSTADYHAMEKAVESRGFKHDLSPEAPICRWVFKGVALDLMPSQPNILGFHNRWYPLTIATAGETAEWYGYPADYGPGVHGDQVRGFSWPRRQRLSCQS